MPKVVSILPRKRFQTTGVDPVPDWDFEFVSGREENELIAACRNADFLLVPSTYPRIHFDILKKLPSVCLIQMAGSGYDQVDHVAAAGLNLPVANVSGENAHSVAEFTIGLLTALQRRIMVADREIKAGNYQRIREEILAAGLGEIYGIKLGLAGLGAIGRQVARLAGMMGAKVSYFTRRRLPEAERELGVEYRSFDQLLAWSDVLSLHIPLNDQTRGLIGKRQLDLMPPGSFIINTARGEVIDQSALAAALESGHLGGAAIDTLFPEPPPPDHPLLTLSPAARDRLLITPHLAGVTSGSFKRMLRAALENMQVVASGGEPRNVVNGIKYARRWFKE